MYRESISNSIAMSLSKLLETVKDREAWHAAAHRIAKNLPAMQEMQV